MNPNEVAADILDEAADVLEKDGWTRYTLTDGQRYCAVGAVRKAFVNMGLMSYLTQRPPQETATSAFGALTRQIGEIDIARWNDRFSTTKQEVLDAFRAAAKSLRQ